MWHPYKYYHDEAKAIVLKEGIRYERKKYGYDKGNYTAHIIQPPQFKDKSHNLVVQYYQEKYGLNIPTSGRYDSSDKEQAKRYFINEIAHAIEVHSEKINSQPVSDVWAYYNKHKDNPDKKSLLTHEGNIRDAESYFVSDIGSALYEYFKILDGSIDSDNWKEFKSENSKIAEALERQKTFEEFYYLIKEKAREEFLSHNRDLSNDYQRPDKITSYVFDEENIPEIADIEKSLKEPESSNEQPIKTIMPYAQVDLEELLAVTSKNDNGYIKIGYRKDKFLKGHILLGRSRVITLANNEVHRSVFAIVELADILASHDEQTYESTPDYPVNAKGENINDRNYKDDKNAQYKVRQIAQQFNPEVQVSTSATAAGLPVITIDGITVSGNNRIMSMKLMSKEFVENYQGYLQVMSREITTFGFDYTVGVAILMKDSIPLEGSSFYEPKNIKFEKPILVRIDIDFPEYNTGEMAKYNKETKKVKRAIDRAIELGKILESNPACLNSISDIISKFENISDLYVSMHDVMAIKKYFIECNLLTENELPAFITNNLFTNSGKEFLENLMAGIILDKDELILSEMDGVKKMKQIIVQSLPVLIKNSKLQDYSLKQYINDAIRIQHKMVSSGLLVTDLISQTAIFDDTNFVITEKGVIMNLLLNTGKIKFKKAMETYNNSAEENIGGSMFGEAVSMDDMFEKLFIPLVDEKTIRYIKNIYSKQHIAAEIKEKPEGVVNKEQISIIEKRIKGLEIAMKYNPKAETEGKIKALKAELKMIKE